MNAIVAPPEPFSERRVAIEDLDNAIVKLSARINASTYQLLVLIREFDERAGFLKWGLANTVEWLHWRCDLGLSAAREKVRCARALKDLPLICDAFEMGVLSYSKVRALTRVSSPENEEGLVAFASRHSAARVEERCRQLRNVMPEALIDAQQSYENRSFRIWREGANARITVELPREEADLIAAAVDKAMEVEASPDAESASWSALQADALIHLARSFLSGKESTEPSSNADAFQVVVHVDETALSEGKGRSDVPLETARRLTCDGSLIRLEESAEGEQLNVGRKQRTIPTAIKRALWARDQGCSFPGCTHKRFVDAHHVKHWSKGGETSLDNLMLLCSRHHRLVHEGGYEICNDHRGNRYFRRPDGRAIPRLGYCAEDYTDVPLGESADVVHEVRDGIGNWTATRIPPRRGAMTTGVVYTSSSLGGGLGSPLGQL